MEVKYRLAENNDLDGIFRVEKSSFSSPWLFESLLYDVCLSSVSIYIVALVDKSIIGFCGAHLVVDECHINNVAVLPKFRRAGVGQGLVKTLMTLTQETVTGYTLEVRQSNINAIKLYQKFGFTQQGIRENYYADTQEDALIMFMQLKA
ncbi:MAG: ribosomal protein S18-alanine N-acetyltransferase [Clostridia bacterium]|jgi:[ribosomal protein S18]-alanine N-acetyltransferase|nr:ribosomal protein S18-alanine N-acetyltransferase [Clostridia bacterium]